MKDLLIRKRGGNAAGSCFFEIYYDSGGQTPDILGGLYTSEAIAHKAIEAWKVINKAKLDKKKKSEENLEKVKEYNKKNIKDK